MLRWFHRSPRSRLVILVTLLVVGGALFAGLALMKPGSSASPAAQEWDPKAGFDVALDDSRKVTGFVESYGQRIDEARRDLGRKEEEFKGLKAAFEKQSETLTMLVSRLAELDARAAGQGTAGKATAGDPLGLEEALRISQDIPISAPAGPPPSTRIEKITLPAARKAEAEALRKDEVRLPAGSFAEGTLLTGVYAPTQGSAQPVQMRVDLTFIGPSRSRIPIQGAFVVGKAVGEPNAVRAVIQLEKISFVREGGQAVEVPVNGYVADDDGVMGLSGQYVWRIHEAAGLATLSGGLSAGAEAAAAKETINQLNPLGGTTTIVTGDVGRYALAKGASRAADEVAKIVTKRLDEIVPAIYVPNGKRLTLVLIDGVTLSGVPLAEVNHENARNPHAGLDLDR